MTEARRNGAVELLGDVYGNVAGTLEFARQSYLRGDDEGEIWALKRVVGLALDLLGRFYGDEEGEGSAVELDGVREVQGEVPDLQETAPAQEEGAQEAHVVPLVQDGDAAPGEVLSGGEYFYDQFAEAMFFYTGLGGVDEGR